MKKTTLLKAALGAGAVGAAIPVLIDHLLVHAVEFDKTTLRLLRISQIDNRLETVKR